MLTASELKALLKAQGLRLTKRLGQHHLVDARVVQRIVERCELSPTDTVVEIGPGLGALTERLAARADRVIAVEIDRRMAGLLAERLAGTPNVTVRCEDILDFSWDGLADVTVVGAIPYQLTSPILGLLAEARQVIRKAILILQEEVAQRLLARPRTKAYGRLSVLAAYCWEASALFPVPRSAFFPQPNVDSRCVQLVRRIRPPVTVFNESRFFAVVKSAFSHRRKTLVNCLLREEDRRMRRADAERLVQELGLPLTVRGEALSLEQFASLANADQRRSAAISV